MPEQSSEDARAVGHANLTEVALDIVLRPEPAPLTVEWLLDFLRLESEDRR